MNTSMMIEDPMVHIASGMFGFANSMVLKCAVELRIADIIHSHGHAITVSEIASAIDSDSIVNVAYLQRIMRMLARMKIFTSNSNNNNNNNNVEGADSLVYGLTPSSELLMHEAEISLAPMLLMENYPTLLSPWHYLSRCVKEGGSGFKKAHGVELFEMAGKDHELNKVFNDSMRCISKIFNKGMFSSSCRGVFDGVDTMVDVGGGVGHLIAEIVKEFPNIKGINFDLPHAVKTAPELHGVNHVAGDMFKEIPNADAFFIKNVLLNWGDEDCIKILKNCRRAMNKKTGKIIIVDIIVKEEEEAKKGLFGNQDVILDLVMMAHTVDGRERTENEWKKILEEAGFPQYNIIHLPFISSLIVAKPE